MSNRWIVLAALVAALVWAAGCGGSSSETETTGDGTVQTTGGELVPAGQAQVGDRTRCPVSGEEFVVTAESPHVEHEGRTYYFCCAHCVERFQANPAQYTQPTAGAEPATGTGAEPATGTGTDAVTAPPS